MMRNWTSKDVQYATYYATATSVSVFPSGPDLALFPEASAGEAQAMPAASQP